MKGRIKRLAEYAFYGGVFFLCGYQAYSYHMDKIDESYDYGYILGYEQGRASELENVQNKIFEEIRRFRHQTKDGADSYVFTDMRLERIMKKSNPKLSEEKRNKYKKYILKWSDEYDLSPVFVAAMIHRETHFCENLVSSAGARGCMQVIPRFHKKKLKKLGIKEKDLANIDYGINIGCQVIREFLDANEWDYKTALYKYVGAINNVQTAKNYVSDIFDMVVYAYE